MGNCIKKQSSMEWGGDDWSDDYSPADSSAKKMDQNNHDDYDKIREQKTGSIATNDDNLKEPKQLKLKITRKQLEQVLELTKTNVQGVSVEQVLAHLINVGINDLQSNHTTRSWRPDLPTITED